MSDDLFADLDPRPQALSQWQKTRSLGEHEVHFVLSSADAAPTKEELQAVARFWDELPSFDARAREILHEDTLEDGSATAEYVEHHLDGLRFEVLTELFGDADDLEIGTFLDALALVQVTLAPGDRAAVFDYSLGRTITDAVLAVSISADAKDWSIEIQSYVDDDA